MTKRHSAASLLAVFVLGAGTAQACNTPDSCPPGIAPTYAPVEPASNAAENAAAPATGAPLRLHATGRRQPSRKAEPRHAAQVDEQVPLPRSRPDLGDGWPAGVYAMDPAPHQAPQAEEPIAQADGTAGTDAGRLNEIDRMADGVQVVSADELNEIDLAAPPAETTGRAEAAAPPVTQARTAPESVPPSWIAGLVFAFGGAAAAASALFIRQTRFRA